jgi:hypothetical protein
MKRSVRVLLAWFDRREAVTALLGFRLPSDHENVDEQSERFDVLRAALLARPPVVLPPPTVEDVPPELEDRAASLLRSVAENGGSNGMRVAIVDLTRVIGFQKAVALDGIDERVSKASQADWGSLFDLCLPEKEPDDNDLGGTFDRDGKGVTLTSLNPNLRVSPVQRLAGRQGASTVAFALAVGSPYVNVMRYKDRLFLKDGYHRSYGLLSRGITRVPAFFSEAETFADVTAGTSGVGQEYLLGTHPPLLNDFLDPTVSVTLEQQVFRRVIRIRAEEFVVSV